MLDRTFQKKNISEVSQIMKKKKKMIPLSKF